MPASPVVDMDRWRAQSRGARPGAQDPVAQDTGVQDAAPAAPAPVLVLPAASRQDRYPGQVGPTSLFGPVMAFGLRARTGPPVVAAPAAVPDEEEAPVATSWARRARSRSRTGARTDARGTSRGSSRGPGR